MSYRETGLGLSVSDVILIFVKVLKVQHGSVAARRFPSVLMFP